MVRSIPARIQKTAIAVAVALLLYAVGLKFLLIPVLLVANMRLLPMPKIFTSWASRLVISATVLLSILQIAATLQFLLFPTSGFVVLATITVIVQLAILCFAPQSATQKRPWFTKADACALLVIGFLLLPFGSILAGRSSVDRIAHIGGIQAIDATNHYAGIAEMTQAEHLNYKPNYYYPKGFHIAVGFMENTVIKRQASLNWTGNVMLYFADYIVLGAMLAYAVYYLSLRWLGMLQNKAAESFKGGTQLLLALCVGPTLAMLYLVPFVVQGFLNYYYVITTIVVGLLFLSEFVSTKKGAVVDVIKNDDMRWAMIAYLLLIFGASISWPLLIPPLVIIPLLFLIPDDLRMHLLAKRLWNAKFIVLAVVFLLQLVPIYFQLKYSGSDDTQGINLLGGLREFHPFILLAGFLIVVAIWLSKQVTDATKQFVAQVFVPLFSFIGLLTFAQFFTVGEIRYYVIKSSLMLEVLILALGVAALVSVYLNTASFKPKHALLLPVVPLFIALFLITTTPNPLKDLRDLFRSHSGQAKPAFFDNDVTIYKRLGQEGKIKHFNSTVLHYNAEQGKLYAHMQVAFWANMMQYDSSRGDFVALHCVGALYSNLAFGTYTDAEQKQMVAKLKECAAQAKARGETFYVLTDKDSAPVIRSTFGDVVKVEY
jgi:hypothetical protein